MNLRMNDGGVVVVRCVRHGALAVIGGRGAGAHCEKWKVEGSSMNFTQSDLDKLARTNPDIAIIDQMNGPDLSAAVANGNTGGNWIIDDAGQAKQTPGVVPTEHEEQAALFEWSATKAYEWPQLENLFAIPNGQYRPGQRPEPGLKAGVPDVALMVPVFYDSSHDDPPFRYCGLFIELKRRNRKGQKNGGLSDSQVDWIERLRHAGYRVAICYGAAGAIDAIGKYLGMK